MRSARIAIIWGKWANMAKSARFANKKGEIVKQRCKKDAKAKENRRTSINHPNLGKSSAATSFGPTFIALLGLVPSTEVVQRIVKHVYIVAAQSTGHTDTRTPQLIQSTAPHHMYTPRAEGADAFHRTAHTHSHSLRLRSPTVTCR